MLVISRAGSHTVYRTLRRFALAALLLTALFVFFSAVPAAAQDRFGVDYGTGAGLGTQDIRATVAKIIRVSLGILGTIFLGFIIYGGIIWMTAGGAAEQVEKAKKIITNATIGLIVIFLAFAITSFVIRRLEDAVFNGPPDGGCVGPGCDGGGCLGGTCSTGGGFNVVAVDPSDAATGVKLCAAVQAMFNADLQPASVNATNVSVRAAGSGTVAGTFAVSGRSFSFSHPDFAPNTSYEATVSTEVRSLSNEYVERERTWSFTTGADSDDVLPQVDAVNPLDGATDVCRAEPIQVLFSEQMNVSTFTQANIILEKIDAGGNATGVALASITPGSDFKSFAAYPVGQLDENAQYRVTLLPGITDSCGKPLDGNGNGSADGSPADAYSWTFTTGVTVDCKPIITGVAPLSGYYGAPSESEIVIRGDFFRSGIASDAYFNNFAADQNCFNALYVPGTVCRISWSNDEIHLKVPVGSTSGPLLVDLGGGNRSNTVQFQVLSPYLGGLSPNSGPVGSFVTVGGVQFGTTRGRVELINTTTGARTLAEYPCADGWQDGSVVIRVPSGLSPGTYAVQLFTAPPAGKASNRLSFTVNTGPLAPGLCTIAPQCGGAGTSVNVTGERLGTTQGASTIAFGALTASPTSWSDTMIATPAPAFSQDGTYAVAVAVQGLQSNELGFTTPCAPGPGGGGGYCGDNSINVAGEQCDGAVPPPPLSCVAPAVGSWQCDGNCQLFGCTGGGGTCGNNAAEGSEQCDGSDRRGLDCQSYGGGFSGGALSCDLNCGFDTSGCVTPGDEPRILEQPDCDLTLQSPSPYRDANDACRNAEVSVTFDRDMNDATFAGIRTVACGSAAVFNSSACAATPLPGTIDAVATGAGGEAYRFTPAATLAPNTWYLVSLPMTVASAVGVPISAPYEWFFRTRAGTVLCAPTALAVEPYEATITEVGGTQDFLALPTGGSCNILSNALTYAWTSADASRATVGGSATEQETATAVAENAPGVPTDITAQAAGGVQGSAQLYTIFNPLICETSEDCSTCGGGASQCVNNACTPVVEDVGPSPSPVGSWVTISGCYFGNAQGTVTYGGGVAGLWPDPDICGASAWTNTQIISEVPAAAVSGNVTVRRTDDQQAASPTSLTVGGSARPDLCRIDPSSGLVGGQFTLQGQGFGASRTTGDQVAFGATALADTDYRTWAEKRMEGTVPGSLSSGVMSVVLTNDTVASNPMTFTITGGGLGDSCDADGAPLCQADDRRCATGLLCDASAGCSCQPAPALRVVDFSLPGANARTCPNAQHYITFNTRVAPSTISQNTIFMLKEQATACVAEGEHAGAWLARLQKRVRGWVGGEASAQAASRCPQGGLGFRIEDGDFWAGNGTALESRVFINPATVLDIDTAYQFIVRGGSLGVKSAYGTELANTAGTFTIESETFPGFQWMIRTGMEICQISALTVTITRGTPPNQTSADDTRDFFLCGGRDNCPDDSRTATGNQHTWTAKAWDSSAPPRELAVAFHWTEETDANNIFSLSGTETSAVDLTLGEARSGNAAFSVGAHAPNMGAATTSVSVDAAVCDNPWPSPSSFPYTDQTYNFSLWYCRDQGAVGAADDLPALNAAPVRKDNTSTTPPRILREYLFLRNGTRDAIGLRIYENPGYLSLREWYQRNTSQPGSPGESTVDGFPALRDGRSVYVLAPTIAGTFYTNVFVLSYNEGADADTQQIMNGLIAHWKFMVGTADADKPALQRDMRRVTDLGTISGYLTAYADSHKVCTGTTIACTEDAACGSGKTCDRRYPSLAAGSYLVGYSTSRWPSWQGALGNALGKALPQDPVNQFPKKCSIGPKASDVCSADSECQVCDTSLTPCVSDIECPLAGETCLTSAVCALNDCPAPAFDQASCWNDQSKQFVCPQGSYLYAYQSNGSTFTLGARLESASLASSGGAVGACQMNYRIVP